MYSSVIWCIGFIPIWIGIGEALLFPASSLLQLTISLNVPVLNLPPPRRVSFDWGLQMNYDMPYELASFYNIPIFPNLFGKNLTARSWRSHRALESLVHPTTTRNEGFRYQETDETRRHYNDFTAGELYEGMERLLRGYDLHKTCLLRIVCELAQHPFADASKNVVTDVVTFLLTPSMHQGFSAQEVVYRKKYEQAENNGLLSKNCEKIYEKCQLDFLGVITKVLFQE